MPSHEGESDPTPAEKSLPHSHPTSGFGGRRYEYYYVLVSISTLEWLSSKYFSSTYLSGFGGRRYEYYYILVSISTLEWLSLKYFSSLYLLPTILLHHYYNFCAPPAPFSVCPVRPLEVPAHFLPAPLFSSSTINCLYGPGH